MERQKTSKESIFYRGLKDIFYETRVLMGRGYTLNRFATEALGGSVDPVMLSYIEKGKRFATEALVHKLAQIRGQDPNELLVLLWLDRIVHAFSKEIRRAIKDDKTRSIVKDHHDITDADFAVIITQTIAALPDDGGWLPLSRWQQVIKTALGKMGDKESLITVSDIIHTLQTQGLVQLEQKRVKRLASHYVPTDASGRRSLAVEFCAIFTKGLLNKIVQKDKKTHVRNHYLYIPEENIEKFYEQVDENVRKVVEKYATEEAPRRRFVNVLITAVPL